MCLKLIVVLSQCNLLFPFYSRSVSVGFWFPDLSHKRFIPGKWPDLTYYICSSLAQILYLTSSPNICISLRHTRDLSSCRLTDQKVDPAFVSISRNFNLLLWYYVTAFPQSCCQKSLPFLQNFHLVCIYTAVLLCVVSMLEENHLYRPMKWSLQLLNAKCSLCGQLIKIILLP